MVKQKEMVKLENWLNRKMVKWKIQLNRKNWLNRKNG